MSSSLAPEDRACDHRLTNHGLFLVIDLITSNEDVYRRFLSYRGEDAQVFIDLLQRTIISYPSPIHAHRVNAMTALLRLVRRAKLLPSLFHLRDITHIRRVFELETPSTDIFQGVHQGKRVFLKRYRFCSGSLSHDQRRELLHREAVLWANHQHIGVLPFSGVFQHDDAYDSGMCLVSPYLENGTIVAYLKSYPHANRCLLTLDIISALSYLHSNNIVHGDIKGANVLVSTSGHACLADLGYSRLTEAAVLTWTTVQSMASLGTFPWQAPELLLQARMGGRIVPMRTSDIYSFGCLLYEIFTNHAPFWDLAPSAFQAYRVTEEVLERNGRPTKPVRTSEPYRLWGLTEGIWNTMEWCWARDPSLRPSAFELSGLWRFRNAFDGRPAYDP